MSAQQKVTKIHLSHNTGIVLLVDMQCEGMVGETVTWQKAFHVPSFTNTERTPEMTRLSYRELKPLLEEVIKCRTNDLSDPWGNGYVIATYGEKVFEYTQEQEKAHIEYLKEFLHNMSPEGEKEQGENTTADAISRVI